MCRDLRQLERGVTGAGTADKPWVFGTNSEYPMLRDLTGQQAMDGSSRYQWRR